MVIVVPLLAPLISIGALTGEPLGPLATTFGYIPLTAPIAMPMRMAAAPLPAAQVAASLAILAASVVLVGWLAGKIYRIGILSTGKRPTLKELGHWLRAA